MTVRPLKLSDIPILRAMAEESGFPYPDLESGRAVEVHVVADDEDRPVMAAAAAPILEMYLWCGDFRRPLAEVFAVRLLHESMAESLKAKGWSEVNAFIPPRLAVKFGRRLERTFGWRPNWPSWARRF